MASTTISLRTDTELKAQAEEILNQLGMTLNGTFNMLLKQIVREKSVPLSLSLASQNSLYADLLVAESRSFQHIEEFAMRIAVAGTGYVGLSNSVLLSQHNQVVAVDLIQSKVDLINKRVSPVVDAEISEYLANH